MGASGLPPGGPGRRVRLPLVLLLGLLGGSLAPPAAAPPPPDDGRPLVRPLVTGCRGKPSYGLATLDAYVVDRPAEDRARVEVAWTRRRAGFAARLAPVLPDGAWLVAGPDAVTIGAEERSGRAAWTIGFETGRPLDLVVRLGARLGRVETSVETYVRLASGD